MSLEQSNCYLLVLVKEITPKFSCLQKYLPHSFCESEIWAQFRWPFWPSISHRLQSDFSWAVGTLRLHWGSTGF